MPNARASQNFNFVFKYIENINSLYIKLFFDFQETCKTFYSIYLHLGQKLITAWQWLLKRHAEVTAKCNSAFMIQHLWFNLRYLFRYRNNRTAKITNSTLVLCYSSCSRQMCAWDTIIPQLRMIATVLTRRMNACFFPKNRCKVGGGALIMPSKIFVSAFTRIMNNERTLYPEKST